MDKNNHNLISIFSISIFVVLSAIVASSSSYLPYENIVSAQQQQQQNASTTSNNTSVQSSSSIAAEKPPTDGYSTPEGHLTAIRHVFDDPTLRVQHYCKPNDKR